jgi:hypothetical protein
MRLSITLKMVAQPQNTMWQYERTPSSVMHSAVNFSILAAFDIGLFSLARDHSAHNFPGKILGYLKAGKPVLGSVNAGNDLLHVINDSNSGFVFLNGEDYLLETASKRLIESAELCENIGDNGVTLLEQKFPVYSAAHIILVTLNLAKQATNKGVKRFIFISSIKVLRENTERGSPFTAD